MAIQTDAPPATIPNKVVAVPFPETNGPSSSNVYRVGSGQHQFQFIPPPPSSAPATTTHMPTSPTGSIRRSIGRMSVESRRMSNDSMTSGEDLIMRPHSSLARNIDKSKPPMMMVPPPPRAPPPPGSMPPPNFIPDRPPPRPSSPPPQELIQRATTPTFGSVLSVPGVARRHGASLPPQGLRQPTSTSSFRSALLPSGFDRAPREYSPRSSLSSEHHPYISPAANRAATPANNAAGPMGGTDPAIIHAITQTMIGEFLYKYTRKSTLGMGGDRRHKRFFWVHPYTRTLYWSDADPGSSNVSESSAKSGRSIMFFIPSLADTHLSVR